MMIRSIKQPIRRSPRPRPRPPSPELSADLALALAAATVAVIFVLTLVLPVPFWHARPAAPPPPGQSAAAALGWPAALLALGLALALCLPYRPYSLAVRSAQAASLRTLLLLSSALAVAALAIYPAFGSDLFVYLDYERLWTVYGANPLLAFPALQPEDWAFSFVWIPQQPSPYGPLWPLLTWPIARLAGDSLWGWIVGYKLLALLSYAACCGLVWACAEPRLRKRALVVFAWSPLVLFEVLGKAHNDSLLALSALGSVWLARRSPAGGLVAAASGALVKMSGAAVLLAFALLLARRGAWRPLLVGLAASGALAVAVYAPFWAGPQSLLPVLVQTSRVVWSPGALLIGAAGGQLAGVDVLARVIAAAAWLGVCALVARRAASLATASAVLLLATLLLLTTAFFAHYLVPVVALAAVAGDRRLERVAMALSIGALAAYAVELLGVALPAGWIGSPGYQVLGSLVTLSPGVAVLVHQGLARPAAGTAHCAAY